MKQKCNFIRIMMCVCVLLLTMNMTVHADEPERLYATGAVLMDADSGRVLYGKNEDEILPMASTTKIMTLLVTLENADLQDVVTISEYAASMPDVQLNIKAGEQYYLRDLVYSMMLESHNDSAVAIAEHVGKSVEGFAEMMNRKAKEIGCVNTWYITPNGLDAEEMDESGTHRVHATTAKELAMVMSYCVTKDSIKDQFMKITQTRQYSFSSVDGTRSFCCVNRNAFLNMMDGVMSGKTGYTGKAGYCYVCALENEGRHFVVALLGCGWPNHKTYKWADTRNLMNYGIKEYVSADLSSIEIDMKKISPVLLKNDQKQSLYEVPLAFEEKNVLAKRVLMRRDELIRQETEQVTQIFSPGKTEENIGKINIYIGSDKVKEIAIRIHEKDIKQGRHNITKMIKKIFFD